MLESSPHLGQAFHSAVDQAIQANDKDILSPSMYKMAALWATQCHKIDSRGGIADCGKTLIALPHRGANVHGIPPFQRWRPSPASKTLGSVQCSGSCAESSPATGVASRRPCPRFSQLWKEHNLQSQSTCGRHSEVPKRDTSRAGGSGRATSRPIGLVRFIAPKTTICDRP